MRRDGFHVPTVRGHALVGRVAHDDLDEHHIGAGDHGADAALARMGRLGCPPGRRGPSCPHIADTIWARPARAARLLRPRAADMTGQCSQSTSRRARYRAPRRRPISLTTLRSRLPRRARARPPRSVLDSMNARDQPRLAGMLHAFLCPQGYLRSLLRANMGGRT